MTSENKSKPKRNRKRSSAGNYPGSGTKSYYRNKRLIEAGETFRSQKRTGPQKSPGSYRSRY